MADELVEESDGILTEFLSWCEKNGLILSKKVKVGLRGSCHRYGMVAEEDIEEGEHLFEIPRSLVLQPKTSSISGIVGNLANEVHSGSERGSGWAPLLLTLMYEYTNPTSHWKPYLNLVPDVTVLDQPMFWGLEERQKELQGTGIEEDVESDVQHIEEEYNAIVLPFIKKHQELFSESRHSVALYKHMAAFVMAYSFTEQESSKDDDGDDHDDDDDDDNNAAPVMVPMADILNHISNNNTHLEFGAKLLTMVATQDIRKGQEIFNTYGKLANCHLLQSYGFVEDELPNPYDMVDVPISAFNEVMKADQSQQTAGVLDAKFDFMEEMGVASEDDMFLFGREGCSHFGPDLYTTLRILHLSKEQFKQLLEEQIQQQRSEEFDDIGHELDQPDDEFKRDTSWRILELVFKAENKKKKRKRRIDEKDSDWRQKKRKSIQYDEVLDPRGDPPIRSEDCNKTYLNGLNTNVDKTMDMSKTSKQDLVQAKDGSHDTGSAGDGKMSENSDDGSSENSDDDDNDDEEVDSGDIDDDDVHHSNINDDCDDDEEKDYEDEKNKEEEEEEEESDDDEEEQEGGEEDDDDDNDKAESEQPLTYELMYQWPIEWRRTLKSVAELCVKKRYGDDNVWEDSSQEDKLSKRQLSVMRIKRGQRSIFRRICELVVEENSQG